MKVLLIIENSLNYSFLSIIKINFYFKYVDDALILVKEDLQDFKGVEFVPQ